MENTQTQKTPEQWFQKLKEPYRSQSIKNIDKNFHSYNANPNSMERALFFSFDWEKSPEYHDYWDNVYKSINAGETTYLEPETLKSEPIELRPEEPTDWESKYNELKAKFDQLEPKGEKVYFCFSSVTNKFLFYENINKALEISDEGFQIYEAVCIGKKKSVLVNE